ncbi:single-stranded-DNA-specific exonuclease RecJ [Yeosuana sp. AK3]
MRWTLKPKPDSSKIEALQKALQVDSIVATLLIERGIETYDEAKKFFRPSLKDLHDPFLMKDMDKAVARIEKAIANQENILVYGDYDVDGTTAVALMSSYLKSKYDLVLTYIPNRYDEGYGISYKGINFALENDFTLIIALDCGIKSVDKVAYAKGLGIDFIICDHHRPGNEMPNAIAVLDPKQDDCNYPYKELCGCGVGFKLIQALASKEGKTVEDLVEYLDLVATAIGADIVPIDGENRVLAYFGLQVINSFPRPGIKAILEKINKTELTITDVVFVVAPRINAAGRMKHGNFAVTLLVDTDYEKALQHASDIDQYNSDRREEDKRITEEALIQIEQNGEQNKLTTVVYQEDWHKGVIGIVASRLTETYYRPTLVFTKSGDNVLAASARSVRDFDIYNVLEACSEHIEQFGGHKYAAGLTLKEENYQAFKQAFEDEVSKTIDRSLLIPEIKIDAKIDLKDITPKFYRIIKQFAPFGPENMTPVFMTDNLNDTGYGKCVGEDKTHLRMTVTQPNSNSLVSIGFGMGDKVNLITDNKIFKAVYSVDENEWNGNVSLQLKLRDIKAQDLE